MSTDMKVDPPLLPDLEMGAPCLNIIKRISLFQLCAYMSQILKLKCFTTQQNWGQVAFYQRKMSKIGENLLLTGPQQLILALGLPSTLVWPCLPLRYLKVRDAPFFLTDADFDV